ncbi:MULTISPECIES: tyrosine-protein phosphatase [unclassified Agarivorans]|uniref:tyrosine-protein phosphatase n=1 Tax=unclassified Agarivorans TaxID=2636026 RepID=UPI003D7EBFA0
MGFVDIHCHILPGIDDGAKDLRQSIKMLCAAVDDGIEVMLATPHILPGVFDNTPQSIRHSYKLLNRELHAQQLPLQLYYAAEVHLCPEIMLWHKQGKLPLLGRFKDKDVLLLELPHGHVPQGFNNFIKWLTARNITPLIAHPERNRGVWNEINLVSQWRRLGCLFQVTAGALLGEFRQTAQQTAFQMLEDDLVDVVASDCHGLEKRQPNLSQAYDKVSLLCGQPRAQRLFIDTPGMIAASCQGTLATTVTSLIEPDIFSRKA